MKPLGYCPIRASDAVPRIFHPAMTCIGLVSEGQPQSVVGVGEWRDNAQVVRESQKGKLLRKGYSTQHATALRPDPATMAELSLRTSCLQRLVFCASLRQ